MFDFAKLTFLDGAMGTMLQQGGLQPGQSPELVALTNPELLTSIHRQYIDAGTDIVYANTFGANRRKLAHLGASVDEVVAASIAAAKKACEGTTARVALDIGPWVSCWSPWAPSPLRTRWACSPSWSARA